MKTNINKILFVVLFFLVTSLSITGISFIDNFLWDKITALFFLVAYGIVGLLYDFGILKNSKDGKNIFYAVLIALIICGFYLYSGILRLIEFVRGWPLSIKICIIIILSLLIILVILRIVLNCLKDNKEK